MSVKSASHAGGGSIAASEIGDLGSVSGRSSKCSNLGGSTGGTVKSSQERWEWLKQRREELDEMEHLMENAETAKGPFEIDELLQQKMCSHDVMVSAQPLTERELLLSQREAELKEKEGHLARTVQATKEKAQRTHSREVSLDQRDTELLCRERSLHSREQTAIVKEAELTRVEMELRFKEKGLEKENKRLRSASVGSTTRSSSTSSEYAEKHVPLPWPSSQNSTPTAQTHTAEATATANPLTVHNGSCIRSSSNTSITTIGSARSRSPASTNATVEATALPRSVGGPGKTHHLVCGTNQPLTPQTSSPASNTALTQSSTQSSISSVSSSTSSSSLGSVLTLTPKNQNSATIQQPVAADPPVKKTPILIQHDATPPTKPTVATNTAITITHEQPAGRTVGLHMYEEDLSNHSSEDVVETSHQNNLNNSSLNLSASSAPLSPSRDEIEITTTTATPPSFHKTTTIIHQQTQTYVQEEEWKPAQEVARSLTPAMTDDNCSVASSSDVWLVPTSPTAANLTPSSSSSSITGLAPATGIASTPSWPTPPISSLPLPSLQRPGTTVPHSAVSGNSVGVSLPQPTQTTTQSPSPLKDISNVQTKVGVKGTTTPVVAPTATVSHIPPPEFLP
eukprot:TRINITY_DN63388_c0_g1_i1.p1 TRINITY_DN63388_c0_g1~~TRINITY_DN63388_c0_g1_i1.p1  ORF type:complete len:625 (-),score=83.57 TRINITY_DN63388_c0_g1_i1:47-1921(-)